MTRTLISAIVAIAATAVVYAGQQVPSQAPAHATHTTLWQTANKNFQVLVPVSGTWTADYEKYDTKVVQVLTIDGAAASKAPDAAAARALFGDKSAGFVTALAAPGAFPLAVARDVPTFPSGTLEVTFKLVSGATDQTAGIVFGLQPDGSYTYARYNTKDGNVAVWKFENGERTVLQHGDVHEQLPLNQWHTLQVTIAGAVVSAEVKGSTLAARHTLPAPVQGRVGVWTKTDSVTSFKDFVATGHHLVHR
ncbi:MAG TPA: hypothetical protein VMS54_11830 [Vicinamibacterales bacterium]|nr:hypothetical protein [Vicinamibacterales bacterium]